MQIVSQGSGSCCRQPKAQMRVNGTARAHTRTIVCRLTNERADVKSQQTQTKDKNIFESVIGTLLSRGASRLERGVATCLECRGTGHLTCQNCKGAGVLGPMGRRAIQEAGLQRQREPTAKGDVWLMTNRCPTCRGGGSNLCASCEGTGLRVPSLVGASYNNDAEEEQK